MNGRFAIHPATPADAPELGRLFDQYRLFYQQPSDRAASERFVSERLAKQDTRFLLAREDGEGQASLGFVHLIPAWNTLAMRPIWYLEDLFVVTPARRRGIGRALMQAAERFAVETSAERLTLSTAHDNYAAQALYLSSGYAREEHFQQFHRVLD